VNHVLNSSEAGNTAMATVPVAVLPNPSTAVNVNVPVPMNPMGGAYLT